MENIFGILENEDLELYLKGLSLIMKVDNIIHNEEVEYINYILSLIDIDTTIEELIEFSHNPTPAIVSQVLNLYSNSPIKYYFILDCCIVALSNKELHPNENKFLIHLIKAKYISQVEYIEILNIAKLLLSKKTSELKYILTVIDFLKINMLKHILDYINIEVSLFNLNKIDDNIFYFLGNNNDIVLIDKILNKIYYYIEKKEQNYNETVNEIKNINKNLLLGISNWSLPSILDIEKLVTSSFKLLREISISGKFLTSCKVETHKDYIWTKEFNTSKPKSISKTEKSSIILVTNYR